jgi:hypothetical protein
MRPSELRVVLESEARAIVDELRSTGATILPDEVAGLVLERHQQSALVKNRIEVLWRHLENFIMEECSDLKHTG